jgi:mono/diheme cytochrome c family protein
MTRSLVWLGALSALVWIFWLGQTRAAANDPDLEAGRDLYEKHCELCHGAEGKGDGPLSDELKTPPPNLTEISRRRGESFPEAEIREIIDGRHRVRAHGKSEMPIWGRVFGGPAVKGEGDQAAARKKLDQLVLFLRSIQVSPAKTIGALDR